jgi:multidrug efflux pump subunit AcrA (membrane-fusion protein)
VIAVSRRRALAAASLLAAAVVLIVVLGASEDAEPELVPTTVVNETELRREIPAEGTLRAVETTPITAPQDARMPLKIAWLIDDGDRVEEGDVVIRFDPTDMNELLHGGRKSTEQAESRIERERRLSRAGRDRRDREAAMAELEMKTAEEFEMLNEEIFSRHEIIESQIDVGLAEIRMEHARKVKQIERSASGGKLEVLEVQRRQAQVLIDRAEGALAQIALAAPHQGIVLLHRDRRTNKVLAVGDTVWPGQKLAEVPADAAMEAEVFVLEADGGHLAEGLKVTVTVESAPDRTFTGSIQRVDTLARPRDPRVPVQYFAVVVALEETDREVMKVGQRVRATIALGQDRALVIPRQAVFSRRGEQLVYRKTAAGFEAVAVTLGASTPGRVVVSEGLEAGDEIALRDPEIDRDRDAGQEEGNAPR